MFDFGKVPPTSLSGRSPLGPNAPSPPELKARDLKDAKSIQSYLENNIEPWLKSHQGNFSSSEHRKISSDLQSIVHELSSSTSPLHEALEKFDDLMLGMGFVVPHTLRAEGMALAAEGMQNRALSAFSSVKQSLAALQTDLKAAQSACVSTKGEKELDKASKMLSQAYSRLGHLSSLESKIHMDMDSLNKAIDVCTKSSSDKVFNDAKQSFSILETSTEALSYQVGNLQQQDMEKAESLIQSSIQSIATMHVETSQKDKAYSLADENKSMALFWSLAMTNDFNTGYPFTSSPPVHLLYILNAAIYNFYSALGGTAPPKTDVGGTLVYNILNQPIPNANGQTLLSIMGTSCNGQNIQTVISLWTNLCSMSATTDSASPQRPIFAQLFDPLGPVRSTYFSNNEPNGSRLPTPPQQYVNDVNDLCNEIKALQKSGYSDTAMQSIALLINSIASEAGTQENVNGDGFAWFLDVYLSNAPYAPSNTSTSSLTSLTQNPPITETNCQTLYSLLTPDNLCSPFEDLAGNFFTNIFCNSYTPTPNPSSLTVSQKYTPDVDASFIIEEAKIRSSLQDVLKAKKISSVSSEPAPSEVEMQAMQFFWSIMLVPFPAPPSAGIAQLAINAITGFLRAVNYDCPNDPGGKEVWNILNTSIPFFSPSLTLQQLVSNGQYTYSQQIYFVMDNWYNIAIASPDKQTDPIWTQLCNQAEKNFWNSAGNGKVSNPDAGYLGDISSLISTLQGLQSSKNLSNPSQSDLLPLATAINALYSSANQECNDKADGYALFISEFMNISFTSSGTLQSLAASITSPNPSQADLNAFYSILYPDSTNPIYQGLLTALQNIQNNCYC